jgi:hypothetical protein
MGELSNGVNAIILQDQESIQDAIIIGSEEKEHQFYHENIERN